MPLDTIPTSACAELLRINQEIEAATAERDEIQRRHDRISTPAIELQNTVAELALAKAEYDAEIVAWYEAACPGDRPQPNGTLLSLEKAVGVLKSDIGASDGVLASATEALGNANAGLGFLHARKRSLLYAAAVEAAASNLSERCLPAIIDSLTELAAVQSIAAALRSMRDPEALSAAMSIERAVFETRNSIALRGNMTAATAFLSTLAQDPTAEIPVPQCDVERVNLPVIRPMEDGSRHINRAPTEPAASPVEAWIPAMVG